MIMEATHTLGCHVVWRIALLRDYFIYKTALAFDIGTPVYITGHVGDDSIHRLANVIRYTRLTALLTRIKTVLLSSWVFRLAIILQPYMALLPLAKEA
jgi:hypothetical protein